MPDWTVTARSDTDWASVWPCWKAQCCGNLIGDLWSFLHNQLDTTLERGMKYYKSKPKIILITRIYLTLHMYRYRATEYSLASNCKCKKQLGQFTESAAQIDKQLYIAKWLSHCCIIVEF